MLDRFLTRQDRVVWAALFVFVSFLLVVTGFASDDPDSALYANLSAKLAQGPTSNWIAPQWWGYWDGQGLFREHPAGVFLIPTALTRLGIPAVQGSYIVGIAAGLVSLVLIGWLVSRLGTAADGRAMLVLLQLTPVAFLFRIRANHEYPMLVCLLVMIVGLEGVRRGSWWWTTAVAGALTAALLVKGVFVVFVLLGAGLWVLINPTRATGSIVRPIVALVMAALVAAAIALAYDALYLRRTGETFWLPYWRRQLGPLEVATPIDGASTIAGHLVFYLSRVLWHAAPWSVALVIIAVTQRARLAAAWATAPATLRRGVVFALLFVGLVVMMLLPSSRFAERYAFSATFALAALGAMVAWRHWPALTRLVSSLDRAVPAFPAVLWGALMLLRIVVGPYLPRLAWN